MLQHIAGLAFLGWFLSAVIVTYVPLWWVRMLGGILFMVCAALFVATTSFDSKER